MIKILVWLAIAYACYYVAKSKGLNTTLWTILGLLFSLITLIVVLLIPSKN